MAENILQHVLNKMNYLFENEQAKYRELKERIMMLEERKRVAFLLDVNPSDVSCPHCPSHNVKRWGVVNDLQRYRCNGCKTTFNAFTKTPLARLRRKGRWYLYAFCMTEGKTLQKSADFCGVHLTTAFRWRHRFLNISGRWNPARLTGIVEADSVALSWSYKGQSRKKAKLKRHPKNAFIISGRDRHNQTLHRVWRHYSLYSLKYTYNKNVAKDALLCTDNLKEYKTLSSLIKVRHGVIDRGKGVFFNKEIVHLENIMSYHVGFLLWMKRFYGVASSYLKNYLAWYRMLDEYKMHPTIDVVLQRARSAV